MSRFDSQESFAQKSTRTAHVQRDAAASAWDIQAAQSPQRTLGNQALARRAEQRAPHSIVQMKMVVGPAQDVHEQEADSVAEQVVNNIQASRVQREEDGLDIQTKPDIQMKPVAVTQIRRQEEEDEVESTDLKRDGALLQRDEEEDEVESTDLKRDGALLQRDDEEDEIESTDLKRDGALLQRDDEEDEIESTDLKRDPAGGLDGGVVGDDVESQIHAQRGGGSAIPESTRTAMESGFGADFSGVRIHQGGSADSLNRSLSAKAFTSGSDIFFRSGEYDPESRQGQQLLAHELTHVVQQGSAQQHN